MARKTYIETFAEGPGGGLGWNENGAQPLAFVDRAALSRGPWWIDSNHAPPGGGYLHLLYCLHLHEQFSSMPRHREAGGPHRFVEGGFPTDLTNAKMTLRLAALGAQRGLLKLRAHLARGLAVCHYDGRVPPRLLVPIQGDFCPIFIGPISGMRSMRSSPRGCP